MKRMIISAMALLLIGGGCGSVVSLFVQDPMETDTSNAFLIGWPRDVPVSTAVEQSDNIATGSRFSVTLKEKGALEDVVVRYTEAFASEGWEFLSRKEQKYTVLQWEKGTRRISATMSQVGSDTYIGLALQK
ncbi:MAG: hypothetical protein AAB932_00400 [Patescibacteria group bacterium]